MENAHLRFLAWALILLYVTFVVTYAIRSTLVYCSAWPRLTTVTTTFVQATFVLGTFLQISNISAVTGPIWIKL